MSSKISKECGSIPRSLQLLGEIGATRIRLAYLKPHHLVHEPLPRLEIHTLDQNADPLTDPVADPLAIIIEYLARCPNAQRPHSGALAIAGTVLDDHVNMTNRNWRISRATLAKRLGFTQLLLVNDFTATALAIPGLDREVCVALDDARPRRGAPMGVLGPGSGLGMAGLYHGHGAYHVISGEGGHGSLAADHPDGARIIAVLRERFGHVSAERVLSGPGLVNLYSAIAQLDGGAAIATPTPAHITRLATEGDPVASRALGFFFAFLGSVAGDLALTLGARGGIYLAGGILPRLLEPLLQSDFRKYFENKGRFSDYLKAIPVFLITHPAPALPGLAYLLAHPQCLDHD